MGHYARAHVGERRIDGTKPPGDTERIVLLFDVYRNQYPIEARAAG